MLRCESVAFARWDPFRDLIALQHRMDRLSTGGTVGWSPAVDLSESAAAFIITAELPGLTRAQIDVTVRDGRLTLTGRRDTRVAGCDHYHQVERGHGEFSRTFVLPPTVDAERISADLADGILTVVVPKSAEPGPRRVDVS